MDWSFSDKWGGEPCLNYDALDEITAIERLAAVVLNGASPSQTNGGRIADVYRNAQTKEELLRKHPIGGTIKTVKLYKNGRFEIEFGNHEEAKRVAAMIS